MFRMFCYASMVGAFWATAGLPCALACVVQDPPVERPTDPTKLETTEPKSTASPEATLALALLGSLTPDHMKQLGQMLEQDWKKRPEWGDMAVAILKGERMRVGTGWWRPAIKRYDWSWLRGKFDANQDGVVDRVELPESLANCEKLFTRLDRDRDGKLTAADLEAPDSTDPATMIASMLFYGLDTDANGRVSLDELAAFFAKSDGEQLGFLTPEDLRTAIDDTVMRRNASRGQGGEPPASEMLRMFLSGQMGWLESGAEYGDIAPDFTLPTHDGSRTVTLSDSRARKPVVLIFGSFT